MHRAAVNTGWWQHWVTYQLLLLLLLPKLWLCALDRSMGLGMHGMLCVPALGMQCWRRSRRFDLVAAVEGGGGVLQHSLGEGGMPQAAVGCLEWCGCSGLAGVGGCTSSRAGGSIFRLLPGRRGGALWGAWKAGQWLSMAPPVWTACGSVPGSVLHSDDRGCSGCHPPAAGSPAVSQSNQGVRGEDVSEGLAVWELL